VRKVTALLACTILVALLVQVVPYHQPVVSALRITAETYDRWLTPCKCYGGTLRVAMPSDVTTLNWWVAGATWDLMALDLLYDRPLRIINGTLTWEVAEYLEYSEDYLSDHGY